MQRKTERKKKDRRKIGRNKERRKEKERKKERCHFLGLLETGNYSHSNNSESRGTQQVGLFFLNSTFKNQPRGKELNTHNERGKSQHWKGCC